MDKQEIERDAAFLVSFASSVLILYMTWKAFKDLDSTTELQMRVWRMVSRTSKHVSEQSARLAASADTAYLKLTL